MQQAIVTGAAGWLGRGLVNALARGLPDCKPLAHSQPFAAIRAMDLPECVSALEPAAAHVDVLTGDVRDLDSCRRLMQGAAGATLFHLAGIIHPRRVREFYAINLQGTSNVLAAAKEAGVRRAVIVSSNSPLGCNPHPDHLFDEQSPYHPYMNYGRSKMLMEQHVHSVQAEGGLETVLIRAPWFYGPFQPPRQKLFFTMVRDGKAPIVGGGNNLRSMAYIDNLCQGLLLAGSVPRAAGQTYWIADRRPYSMNEIVDTIERLLEREFNQPCAHRRLRLPGIASEIAWCGDWLIQQLGGYAQKLHVLSEMNKTIACSTAKAERELGYDPQISLEEGMRRSLAEAFA